MSFINNGFARVIILTVLLLLIPLMAMQFTNEVNWSKLDFIVMSLLCLTMGSLFVVFSRAAPQKKLLSGVILSALFIYTWLEFSVGVFTNLGN